MSNVWFCSDLHIGHKNIHNFRKEFKSEQENRDYIKLWFDRVVTKRDIVYFLGDICFTEEAIDWVSELKGTKILIRGNHDDLPTISYLRVFNEIYGIIKYKGYWLSHAPIHPDELRGKINLHGHVHYHNIKEQSVTSCGEICSSSFDDKRYLNCCVENLMRINNSPLISLNQVKEYFNGKI